MIYAAQTLFKEKCIKNKDKIKDTIIRYKS